MHETESEGVGVMVVSTLSNPMDLSAHRGSSIHGIFTAGVGCHCPRTVSRVFQKTIHQESILVYPITRNGGFDITLNLLY